MECFIILLMGITFVGLGIAILFYFFKRDGMRGERDLLKLILENRDKTYRLGHDMECWKCKNKEQIEKNIQELKELRKDGKL